MEKCKIGVAMMLWGFLLVAGAAYGFTPGQYADDASTLALYHLNQSSGTTVVDDASSGRSAHNGTIINGTPNWTTGDFGNGLGVTLNGNVGINCGPLTGMTANYTIEFYFKWNYAYAEPLGNMFYAGEAAFARCDLIDHGASPATYSIDYGVREGNGVWYEINTQNSTTGFAAGLDTNWHDIAFERTWDGTNTGCAIYIDGALAVSGSFAGGFWDPGENLIMPYSGSVGGTFDEIRVSNVARTSFGVVPGGGFFELGDINQDYKVDFKDFALLAKGWMTCTDPTLPNCTNCNNYVPYTADANTLLLWHMNEGTGTVAHDATANHYDLTLNAGGGSGFSWYPLSIFGDGLQTTLSNTSYCKTAKGLPLLNLNGTGLGTNQLSMSAWVQITGTSTNGAYILDINDSAFIRVSTDGTDIDAGFYTWSNHGTFVVASASPLGSGASLADGNWHNVSAVYNGIADANGNANVYLYWDGVRVATASVAANTDIETGHGNRVGLTLVDTQDGTVRIGTPDPTQAYKGFIDEVMISNTVRSKFMFGACE